MNKSASTLARIRRTVSVIIVLMLALSWTTVAYAQAPVSIQYESPVERASGNSANIVGGGGGIVGGGGGAVGSGALGGTGASIGANGVFLGGSGASVGARMLPLTGGGPVLPLVALSTLLLGFIIVPLAVAVPRVGELLTDWRHERRR